jgi:hypothetical protein
LQEIQAVMSGGIDPAIASDPGPVNEATNVLRDPTLSWEAGQYADTHDVYFGTSLAEVDGASRSNPGTILASKGQSGTTFDPGRLEFGTTYFWRVDEVNAPAAGGTIHTGKVWSFTVEPYSVAITDVSAVADSTFDASSVAQKSCDGSGLDPSDQHSAVAEDMWFSAQGPFPHWIEYTFDKLYKLDQMWVWNSNQAMEFVFGLGADGLSSTPRTATTGRTWQLVFTNARHSRLHGGHQGRSRRRGGQVRQAEHHQQLGRHHPTGQPQRSPLLRHPRNGPRASTGTGNRQPPSAGDTELEGWA